MQDVETLQHQNNIVVVFLCSVSESCHRLVILGMITNITNNELIFHLQLNYATCFLQTANNKTSFFCTMG